MQVVLLTGRSGGAADGARRKSHILHFALEASSDGQPDIRASLKKVVLVVLAHDLHRSPQ